MKSLGVIETLGLVAAIQAADAACKAAEVNCIGYRTVGSGRVTICFEGEISAVRTAVERGISVIDSRHALHSLIIPRPEPSVVAAIHTLKGKGFCRATNHPLAAKEPSQPTLIEPAPLVEENAPNREGHKS